MRKLFSYVFKKVTYTCRLCGARQRIPLRRIHFFEWFHELEHGEAVLIACPKCLEGLQTPSPYRTHTDHQVKVDPENPPKNAYVHDFY
jgi:hypothetical protein